MYLKNPIPFNSVITQINELKSRSKDYLMNMSTVDRPLLGNNNELTLYTDVGRLVFNDNAEKQLAMFLGVPSQYLARIKQNVPELYIDTIESLLRQKDGTPRLIRTVDGTARAVLSDSFARLDNDIIGNALETIADSDLEIHGFNLDMNGMSLHLVNPKVEGEVMKGDVVQMGFFLKNSEVGLHAMQSDFRSFRLVCTNGMVVPMSQFKMRRVHSGASVLNTMSRQERVPEYTVSDVAQQVQLLAENSTKPELLNEYISNMKDLQAIEVVDAEATTEAIQNKYKLSNLQRDSIYSHYQKDNLNTRWGMVNAVTRTGQDQESASESIKLETVGGDLTTDRDCWL
jgi:hypothetical protein